MSSTNSVQSNAISEEPTNQGTRGDSLKPLANPQRSGKPSAQERKIAPDLMFDRFKAKALALNKTSPSCSPSEHGSALPPSLGGWCDEAEEAVPPETGGFVSGSGKRFQLSAAQLASAEQRLGAATDLTEPEPLLAATDGFFSGSGKKAILSAEGLARAQRALQAELDDLTQSPSALVQAFIPPTAPLIPPSLAEEHSHPPTFSSPTKTTTPWAAAPAGNLPSLSTPFKVTIPVLFNQRIFCVTCDSSLFPPGAPFCSWCGAPQADTPQATTALPEPHHALAAQRPATPAPTSFPYPKRSRMTPSSERATPLQLDTKRARSPFSKPFSSPARVRTVPSELSPIPFPSLSSQIS